MGLLSGFSGSSASSPELRQLVVGNMIAAAPLLNYMQFYAMSGNADTFRKGINVTGTGQTRSLDEGYSDKTLTPAFDTVALKILGDEVKTDMAHLRRGTDVGALRRSQLESFATNLGLFLQDQLINGDGTGENITGIKTLVPASRKLTLAENGLLVSVGTSDAARKNQLKLFSSLVKLGAMVKGRADCYVMSTDVISLLFGCGLGYVSTVEAVDIYGNMFKVPTFNGIPIVDAGYKNDGEGLVIPSTTTCGTATDCTTVYAVKYGEKENLMGVTNSGVDVVDKGIIGTQYVTMVDFDMNQALSDSRAVAQLDGLRIEL